MSFFVWLAGDNLAERGAQETSSVTVETVHKVAKNKITGPVLPPFKSDASKVTCKGMGLKKAYMQKQNQFTVHAGDAGMYMFTCVVNIKYWSLQAVSWAGILSPSLDHFDQNRT